MNGRQAPFPTAVKEKSPVKVIQERIPVKIIQEKSPAVKAIQLTLLARNMHDEVEGTVSSLASLQH
jgi:hypothetical protein